MKLFLFIYSSEFREYFFLIYVSIYIPSNPSLSLKLGHHISLWITISTIYTEESIQLACSAPQTYASSEVWISKSRMEALRTITTF